MEDEMLKFKKNALLGNISAEPICQAYKQAWRLCGDDNEMLVRLALNQQSQPYLSHACYKELGLTKEYIKKEFAGYINGYTIHDADEVHGYTYGLYVDWNYENDLVVDKDVVGVMWTVGANVVIPTSKCPTIYLSNRSNVHIVGEGFNTVNIKLFDESKITIEDIDKDSEVIVYKYSNKATVEEGKYCFGKVKVFDKQLKL
jgi:hypothetical protein